MNKLYTNIEIYCLPYEIWPILIDHHNYVKWNPLIQEVNGVFDLDAKVRITLNVDEESIYDKVRLKLKEQNLLEGSLFENNINSINPNSTYKAVVSTYIENEVLELERNSFWLGTYIHRFSLRQISKEKTLFENEIQLGGRLISMAWDKFTKHYYEAGLELMNEALKVKAELNEDFYIVDETV